MRLFVAVDVSEEVRNYLIELQKQLPKASQTLTNSFHLTLKFLGETSKLEEIKSRLSKISFSPFELALDSVGFFPNQKHPRVVWAGVKPHEQIVELQKQVDNVLKDFFVPDTHFHPHLTLTRIKEAENYNTNIKIKPLSFKVSSFVLYASKLSPKGSSYTVVQEFKAK